MQSRGIIMAALQAPTLAIAECVLVYMTHPVPAALVVMTRSSCAFMGDDIGYVAGADAGDSGVCPGVHDALRVPAALVVMTRSSCAFMGRI